MPDSLFRQIGAILLALGILAGCGPTAAHDRDVPPPAVSIPAELHGARLLYQRRDGIHLHVLGEDRAERVVADATYPRWAPDGQAFAFVRGRGIWLYDFRDRRERMLAEAGQSRAVVFHPDGRRVWFTDGKAIRSVGRDGGAVETVRQGPEFMELDIARAGEFFVATVKALGYRVRRFDLPGGQATEIGRGCSANVSPDGERVTINLAGHRRLGLYDSRTGADRGGLDAPEGLMFDNQKWSNTAGWIAVVSEAERRDIYVQRTTDGQAWRITDVGDADRPDLFVE